MNVKGIGDKTYTRILEKFGNEDAFLSAARAMDVDAIAAVDGIGEKRAVEIVSSILGMERSSFLKTEYADRLYREILALLDSYACTRSAKNRIALLAPSKDEKRIGASLEFAVGAKALAASLALKRGEITAHLKAMQKLKEPMPKFDSSRTIVVDEYEAPIVRTLSRYHATVSQEDISSDPGLVLYVYSSGKMDTSGIEDVISVPANAPIYEIVPETALAFYSANRETLESVAAVRRLLGWETAIGEALAEADGAKKSELDVHKIDLAIRNALDRINARMKEKMGELSISGDDILEMMGTGMPLKVRAVYDRIISEEGGRIKDDCGCAIKPFTFKYPVEIDDMEFEKEKRRVKARADIESYYRKQKAAKKLAALRDEIEQEVKEVIDFDYKFALGNFALDYDLNAPEIANRDSGFGIRDGIHLNLARNDKAQRISYGIGNGTFRAASDRSELRAAKGCSESTVILTGANSGGKTTLLETFAQTCILAQMGLPVCAKGAKLAIMDELYFFSKQRSLDAGAFESFLRTFLPLVTTDTKKLILADELEAITEIGAASRIIGSFIDMMKETDSYAILVSHMAPEIHKYTDVRIDGIEAKGLDENYELIVDRTPRINYLAKSTPELIIRRLHAKSNGKMKEIYERILGLFNGK